MKSENAFDSLSFELLLEIALRAKNTQLYTLDDPTPMPGAALLIATAHIMAEGGAKHSPVNCNTANSKTNCAASKKAKAERLANAKLIFAFAQLCGKLPENTLYGA